jgi:PP-loop superfamily ATP-utilizing enzyme
MTNSSKFDPMPKKIEGDSSEAKLIRILSHLVQDLVVNLVQWAEQSDCKVCKTEITKMYSEAMARYELDCRREGVDPWFQDPEAN